MPTSNHRLLECSLNILNFIAEQQHPVTFKEICEYTGLPKSTVSNLTQTMVNMQYLNRLDDINRFSIGLKCFETGNAYLFSNPFYSMTISILSSLAMRSNMTTHLGALVGSDIVYLYKLESALPVHTFSFIGKHAPAYATALGKALLAQLDDESLDSLFSNVRLQSMTPNTITDYSYLKKQLGEIRITGIARESGESTPFIKCIGAAISKKQQKPILGISVAMPINCSKEDELTATQYLFEAKEQIESLTSLYKW